MDTYDINVEVLEEALAAGGLTRDELAERAKISRRAVQNVFSEKRANVKTLVAVAKAISPDGSYKADDYKRFIRREPTLGSKGVAEPLTDRQLWEGPGSVEDKLKEMSKRHPSPSWLLLVLKQDVNIKIKATGDAHVRYTYRIANIGSKNADAMRRHLWFTHPQVDLKITGRFNGKELTITPETEVPTRKFFFLTFPKPIRPIVDICDMYYEFDMVGEFQKPDPWPPSWDVPIDYITNELSLQFSITTKKMARFTLRVSDENARMQTTTLPSVTPRRGECKISRIIPYPEVGERYGLTWQVT